MRTRIQHIGEWIEHHKFATLVLIFLSSLAAIGLHQVYIDYRIATRKPPPGMIIRESPGGIIGDRNSKIYHMSNCPDYNKVSEREMFESEATAVAAGYRKAKNCP